MQQGRVDTVYITVLAVLAELFVNN